MRRNITVDRCLDTYRNIKNIYGMTYGLKYIDLSIYIYLRTYIYIVKMLATQHTRRIASLATNSIHNSGIFFLRRRVGLFIHVLLYKKLYIIHQQYLIEAFF